MDDIKAKRLEAAELIINLSMSRGRPTLTAVETENTKYRPNTSTRETESRHYKSEQSGLIQDSESQQKEYVYFHVEDSTAAEQSHGSWRQAPQLCPSTSQIESTRLYQSVQPITRIVQEESTQPMIISHQESAAVCTRNSQPLTTVVNTDGHHRQPSIVTYSVIPSTTQTVEVPVPGSCGHQVQKDQRQDSDNLQLHSLYPSRTAVTSSSVHNEANAMTNSPVVVQTRERTHCEDVEQWEFAAGTEQTHEHEQAEYMIITADEHYVDEHYVDMNTQTAEQDAYETTVISVRDVGINVKPEMVDACQQTDFSLMYFTRSDLEAVRAAQNLRSTERTGVCGVVSSENLSKDSESKEIQENFSLLPAKTVTQSLVRSHIQSTTVSVTQSSINRSTKSPAQSTEKSPPSSVQTLIQPSTKVSDNPTTHSQLPIQSSLQSSPSQVERRSLQHPTRPIAKTVTQSSVQSIANMSAQSSAKTSPQTKAQSLTTTTQTNVQSKLKSSNHSVSQSSVKSSNHTYSQSSSEAPSQSVIRSSGQSSSHQTEVIYVVPNSQVVKHANVQLRVKKAKETPVVPRVSACFVCGAEFSSMAALQKHSEIHQLYICSLCDKRFANANDLRHHKQTHENPETQAEAPAPQIEANLHCSVCLKTFTDLDILGIHRKIHDSNGPFVCDICSKVCNTRAAYQTHIHRHKKERTKEDLELICDQCGKTFPDLSKLKRHRKYHTRKKIFRCPDCGKMFYEKSKVVRHQVVHKKETVNYVCKYCWKTFPQKWKLQMHMDCHKDKKNHKCKVCGCKFSLLRNLERHQKIHVTSA